ncbi:hypothetical protein DFJ74DRAFT_141543 [Hyaloraphidium curvatum]|nr:hypothetical protein DFJ74DRAFT_141543 [Hyaloraphidium curvatum]
MALPMDRGLAVWNANDFFSEVSAGGQADEEEAGPSAAPSTLHDAVDELATKMAAASIEARKDLLGPAKGLIERFLDLQRPRLDPKMIDLLMVDDFLDMFLGYLVDDQGSSGTSEGSADGNRRAGKVADVLSAIDDCSLQLLEAKSERIVHGLQRAIVTNASSGLSSVKRVHDHLLARFPRALAQAYISPLPPDLAGANDADRPFVFEMARYLQTDSTVADMLLSAIFAPGSKEQRLDSIKRYEALRKAGFLEMMVGCVVDGDEDAAVSSSSDFLVRLVEDAAGVDESWILFRAAETGVVVDRLVAALASKASSSVKQRSSIDVLHALVFKSTYRPPRPIMIFGAAANDTKNLPLKDVQQKTILHCASKAEELCRALQFGDFHVEKGSGSQKRFTVARLQLLEILCEVVKSCPDQRADVVLALPWKQLVTWFFEHRSNSCLHTTFFKLFDVLLKSGQTKTLKTVLSKSKMLERLMDSFESELRGMVILFCNAIRLAASLELPGGYLRQLLESNSRWTSFADQLRDETQRQISPPAAKNKMSVVPQLTPLPASPVSGASDGQDLGSLYASVLGFSAPQDAIPPPEPEPAKENGSSSPGVILSGDALRKARKKKK